MSHFALPSDLRHGIENFISDISGIDIAKRAENISRRYNEGKPSRGVIANHSDVAAYLVMRAPATFAASAAALEALARRAPSFSPSSVLDAGSGPGTASWAAVERWPGMKSITMIDENGEMLRAAQHLSSGADQTALRAAQIKRTTILGGCANGDHDLVVASYAIGELNQSDLCATLEALWRAAARALVIVEPGTPDGFARIRLARVFLSEIGAEIAAPCPHAGPCPIRSPDWCHFGQQLTRSRDHMRAKGAKLPFEVEKYSYLAVTRGVSLGPSEARIIAPPKPEKFGVKFRLCGEAAISERLVLKRDKPSFRAAAHKKWGDTLPD